MIQIESEFLFKPLTCLAVVTRTISSFVEFQLKCIYVSQHCTVKGLQVVLHPETVVRNVP